MKKDLFEELRKQCGCRYISDIRKMPASYTARAFMQTAKLEQYTLKELSDAAEYLYNQTVEFVSYAMAESFFCRGMALPKLTGEDYCACCGEVIPEGSHVCPICAKHGVFNKMIERTDGRETIKTIYCGGGDGGEKDSEKRKYS